MNPMDQQDRDLEARLRATLSGHADRAEVHDDLGPIAIARAGRIRRRRTGLGAAAAVAAIALAIPVGIRVIEPEQQSLPAGPGVVPTVQPTSPGVAVTPVNIDLDLAAMPAATEQPHAYVTGRVLTGSLDGRSSTRITIPGAGSIGYAAFTIDGAVAVTYDSTTMQGTLSFLDRAGKVTSTQPYVERARVSPDGRMVAWFTNRRDTRGLNTAGTSLRVKNLTTNRIDGQDRPEGFGGYLFAVSGSQVRYALWTDPQGARGRLETWSIRTDRPSVSDVVPRTISTGGWVIGTQAGCDSVIDPNGATVWQTCDYRLEWLAPDGSYALGTPQSSGYPFTEVTVLRQTAAGYAPGVNWRNVRVTQAVAVDRTTVLLVVEQAGKQAIVRCPTGTGQCSRATPLAAPGTYQLFG